jgi:hypothetical protein
MEFESTRRRFIEIAGVGAAGSIAGCNALQGESDGESEGASGSQNRSNTANSESGDETPTVEIVEVMAQVRLDAEALAEKEQEIAAEIESGNITREEAQQRFQEIRAEEYANRIDSIKQSGALSEMGIEIKDSTEARGALLVAGSASALINALSMDSIDGVFSKERFGTV